MILAIMVVAGIFAFVCASQSRQLKAAKQTSTFRYFLLDNALPSLLTMTAVSAVKVGLGRWKSYIRNDIAQKT